MSVNRESGLITNPVTKELLKYYRDTLQRHGTNPRGVGWPNELETNIRYDRMLRVMDELYGVNHPSLLDVGCGYGGLIDYIQKKKLQVNYTGLDALGDMIEEAAQLHPNENFYQGDLLDMYDRIGTFDYVVCNGILTLKNDNDLDTMMQFTKTLIRQMFHCCRIGIAFNIVSTYVEWYGSKNFYRNPLEILAFCLSELSHHVKLDHSYRIQDYTVYVYRDNKDLTTNNITYNNIA